MKKVALHLSSSILGGLIAVVALLVFQSKTENHSATPPLQSAVEQVEAIPTKPVAFTPGAPENISFVSPAEHTIDAVVHIMTKFEQKTSSYNDFFGQLFGQPHPNQRYNNRREIMGFGSGVIITHDGYIVTNNHVVEGANSIEVTLNNRESYNAKIVGRDPSTDLAVIKIDADELPVVPFGDSDAIKIGEWVLAVGNPLNLTSTVTAGIVSAKARNIHILKSRDGNGTIESFIQTDAAVNPGNSGGALVNTRGELIGINAAIASGTGYFAGYSFAIPVNIVKKVVNDLTQYGSIQRAYIGITVTDVTSEIANKLGLEKPDGVYINNMSSVRSASENSVQLGDVILSINSQEVNSSSRLTELVGLHAPGDIINVELIRDGKVMTIPITLINKSGGTEIINTKELLYIKELQAEFLPLSNKLKEELNITHGVSVTSISGGVLSRIGMRPGYIITEIDKEQVSRPEDIMKILSTKSGGVLIEGLYPNGKRQYYGIGLR